VLDVINRMTLWQFTLISWLAWLLMCLVLLGTPRDSNIGLTQIAESWGAIERVAVWQDALRWAWPVYELPPGVIAYGIRLSFVVLFALQAIVFWQTLSTRNPSFWKWMIGPLGSHLIMLLMPPSNSDVYFYAMIGDLTSNGINPYLHELQQFPDHPLLPYEHWIDIGTVYGPIWTNICGVIVSITGPDPVLAIIGFKIFVAAVAVGLSTLVYSLARFITGKQSLAVADVRELRTGPQRPRRDAVRHDRHGAGDHGGCRGHSCRHRDHCRFVRDEVHHPAPAGHYRPAPARQA
jgi:hypothetical protein